jgi:hypothetical protein
VSSIAVDVSGVKAALDRYLYDLKDASGQAMDVALKAAEKYARFKVQAQTKRRTGELSDKITGVKISPFRGRLYSLAKHSVFIEEGTKPHGIRARDARALRFTMGGASIYARRVHHPGTEPRPFMAPAATVGEQVLQRELQNRADMLARSFAA